MLLHQYSHLPKIVAKLRVAGFGLEAGATRPDAHSQFEALGRHGLAMESRNRCFITLCIRMVNS